MKGNGCRLERPSGVLARDVTGARADADKARQLLEARLIEHPGELRSMRTPSSVISV